MQRVTQRTTADVRLLFVVLFLFLLASGFVAVRNVGRLADERDTLNRTNDLLISVQRLQSTLQDAETGQRGYFLADDTAYLDPYRTASARLPRQLVELTALIASQNGEQVARRREIGRLAAAKIDELEQTIDLWQSGARGQALDRVRTGRGKAVMDSIRDVVDAMQEEARTNLSVSQVQVDGTHRTILAAVTIGTALGVLLLVVLYVLNEHRNRSAQEAADALFTEQERLRITLASIGDGILTTDEKGLVTFLNPVAERLIGMSIDEARGRPFHAVFDIVNETTRQPVENPIAAVLETGTVVGLANHTILIAKDGVERPIDDSAAPIPDAQGRLTGVVLVFRDVTAHRAREHGLLESQQQLRDADARKDEFLAILSHELRGPLAPVRNLVEVIKRSASDEAVVRQATLTMERQLRHLVSLVDDLLDANRIALGKLELRREPVVLHDLVMQAIETSLPMFEEKRQRIQVNALADGLVVDADFARLLQVTLNLLHNASKYTPSDGEITVSLTRANDRACLQVRDNGIGIAPDMLEGVFDMFTQIPTAPGRGNGGLGIGLTLVRRLVELHGGQVYASSGGRGRGSEFAVELPLSSGHAETSTSLTTNELLSSPSVCRILVVDDNRDSADSLAALLQLDGHAVEARYGGEAAIECARAWRPHIVLLDLGLPGLSGLDVCRQLRADGRVAPAPTIVALTGWGQDSDVQATAAAGFDEHLVKPVAHAVLTDLVARVQLAADR